MYEYICSSGMGQAGTTPAARKAHEIAGEARVLWVRKSACAVTVEYDSQQEENRAREVATTHRAGGVKGILREFYEPKQAKHPGMDALTLLFERQELPKSITLMFDRLACCRRMFSGLRSQ